MDAAAKRKQPSLLLLASTAIVCGGLVAVAYQDRCDRLALAAATQEASSWSTIPAVPEPRAWQPAAQRLPADSNAESLQPPTSASWPSAEGGDSVSQDDPQANPWAAYEPEYLPVAPSSPTRWSNPPTQLPPQALPRQAQTVSEPELVLSAPTAPTAANEDHPFFEDSPATEVAESESVPTNPATSEIDAPEEITPLPHQDSESTTSHPFRNPADLSAYLPATSEVSHRLSSQVRAAFSLGRHGALYAANEKFVDVLRQIASAQDVRSGDSRHNDSLDAGLLALTEARDFLPGGVVSKELSVAEAAASHRTPVLHDAPDSQSVPPRQAAARYYQYAEQQLAQAVQGEQAGSMALYGLGKTYAQLAKIEEDDIDQQKSLAMYRAAVLAHQGNHMAANELGVGLAAAGHYPAAAQALARSVTHGGGSTVYRNLAQVQQKLGHLHLARQTSFRAEQLAQQERAVGAFSRDRGVQWVSPEKMASGQPVPGSRAASPAGRPTVPTKPAAPPSRPRRFALRLFGRGNTPSLPAVPAPLRQANATAAPVAAQTIFLR